MSPLCQRMFDLCMDLDVPSKGDLIQLVASSELEDQLSIAGHSLLLSTCKMFAGVFPLCRHLTSEI